MRIAIYMENYSWGGMEEWLLNLLEGWPDKGDQFTFFTNTTYPGYKRVATQFERFSNLTVKLFEIQSSVAFLEKYRDSRWFLLIKAASYPMLWLFYLRLKQQARSLLKNAGPFDCLVADNGGYPGGWGCLASVVAAHELDIKKRILLIHHCAIPPRPLKKTFENYVDRLMLKCSTDIVTVSKATAQTLKMTRKNFSNLEPKTIYNGISIPPRLHRSSAEIVDIRQRYDLQEKILIGMVGRIEKYKGHDDLIEALGRLDVSLLKNVKVLFIGSGDDSELARLKKLAEKYKVLEYLLFTGYLGGTSQSFIAQLDLLTMLTKDFEGFGLTLGEAMSVGTPVLATRVGAVPEFVTHKISGFLVAPFSPIEIAEALRDFLMNRQEWLRRSEKAKLVIAGFSNQRLGREFCDLVHG